MTGSRTVLQSQHISYHKDRDSKTFIQLLLCFNDLTYMYKCAKETDIYTSGIRSSSDLLNLDVQPGSLDE